MCTYVSQICDQTKLFLFTSPACVLSSFNEAKSLTSVELSALADTEVHVSLRGKMLNHGRRHARGEMVFVFGRTVINLN